MGVEFQRTEVEVSLCVTFARLYSSSRDKRHDTTSCSAVNIGSGRKAFCVKSCNVNINLWETEAHTADMLQTCTPFMNMTKRYLSHDRSFVSHFISFHLCRHSCLSWETWRQRDELPFKFHRCQSYSSFRQMGRGRSGGCWAPRAPVRQQTASWITTGRFVSLSEGLSSYDDTLVNSTEALQSISQMQCPQPSNKGSEWEEDLHG